jgi:hypothetical protein
MCWIPDLEVAPEGTIGLLMEQIDKDPDREKRLAKAYDTLENEAAASEPDSPHEGQTEAP